MRLAKNSLGGKDPALVDMGQMMWEHGCNIFGMLSKIGNWRQERTLRISDEFAWVLKYGNKIKLPQNYQDISTLNRD